MSDPNRSAESLWLTDVRTNPTGEVRLYVDGQLVSGTHAASLIADVDRLQERLDAVLQWCELSLAPRYYTDAVRSLATGEAGIIHRCPLGDDGITPCCRRNPIELPRLDRLTEADEDVTCRA